ncbi:MAG TPA: hypothetical protein VHY35_02045 [Stellaceae bacterium]|jgi:hypothetical protein|nr:hypothetical protein [Stellaceae bacterium]
MTAPRFRLTAAEADAAAKASDDDSQWFAAHPREMIRVRPARPHELPGINAGAGIWVKVQQIAPGIRIRKPYLPADL